MTFFFDKIAPLASLCNCSDRQGSNVYGHLVILLAASEIAIAANRFSAVYSLISEDDF